MFSYNALNTDNVYYSFLNFKKQKCAPAEPGTAICVEYCELDASVIARISHISLCLANITLEKRTKILVPINEDECEKSIRKRDNLNSKQKSYFVLNFNIHFWTFVIREHETESK